MISQNKIEKSYDVLVSKHLKRDYKAILVSMKINDFNNYFCALSTIVTLNGIEITSQLDDINGENKNDELGFVIDMRGDSSINLQLIICNIPLDKKYESRVYSIMILNDKNKKFRIITTLCSC